MVCGTREGEITFPVSTAWMTPETNFYVIEWDVRYMLREVPSTLHQALKASTLVVVKMVYVEQSVTTEMFDVDEVIP